MSAPLGANETVRVSFDGGATFAPATVSGSSWTVVDAGAHGAGWTIVANVANSVTGRTGTQAAQRVVLDTTAPAQPTIDPASAPVTTTTAQLEAERAYGITPAAETYTAPAHVETGAPVVTSPMPVAAANLPDPRFQAAAPGGTASRDAWATHLLGSAPAMASDMAGAEGLRQLAELSDIYTRDKGFRTVVARSGTAALLLFQGVPDQFIDAGHHLALTVPSDAFVHTQPQAVVRLAATLQDGRPLPRWVAFHSESGQFTGEPPPGVKGELAIKLTARDADGREATALFRINIGHVQAAPGKSGLSEQLRKAGPVRVAARFVH